MDLSLEERLLRFLAREEQGERRALRELRSQPVDARVVEGECIRDAKYLGEQGGQHRFGVTDNASKFRSGDTVIVGDGLDLEGGVALVYGDFDAKKGELRLERDPFLRDVVCDLEPGNEFVIDRRPLSLQGRLRDAVRAAFESDLVANVLRGKHEVGFDEGRRERARKALTETELNDSQIEAGALAIGTESLALVQGPPGTGKTRLLAQVAVMLARAGCRIAVCAYTHRAVDNALLAIRGLASDLEVIKLESSSSDGRQRLRDAGVSLADARRVNLPKRGVVVGSTCYQLGKLHDRERFHYTVFDEAGQMPIPHALPGMLRAQRWLFFGDHQQLPPVVTSDRADPQAANSIFEHLHRLYGSQMLDTSYRLNTGVCDVVSGAFYEGALRPSDCAAERRMPFVAGGRLDEVLTPDLPVVWLRIDHRQPGQRSTEEANAVADVVEDVVRQHGVPPEQVAVIAPFRAQVRMLRSAIQNKGLPQGELITVDTVERIQGQEREVVVVSLTAGDPDANSRRGAFHLSINRLNVALSRARTKAVLVASRHAFESLPHDAAALRMASRCKELRDRLPVVDLTKLYAI
ncbi:MAG: AAA domain-containing protein [bacterium]|nr:AAA domain-containing protein [bacterium]